LQWSTGSGADEGRIFFQMEADTTGWVGVGFSNSGSGHSQTDSFVGWVPDELMDPATLFDQFSVQRSQPIDDGKQNGDLTSAVERNGVTTINFNRPLDSVMELCSNRGMLTRASFADGRNFRRPDPSWRDDSCMGLRNK
jgi:hypothetical protein